MAHYPAIIPPGNGGPHRPSRVSGNPERYLKDQPVAAPPPDSRLRGNDGGGRPGMTVGAVLNICNCPKFPSLARLTPPLACASILGGEIISGGFSADFYRFL